MSRRLNYEFAGLSCYSVENNASKEYSYGSATTTIYDHYVEIDGKGYPISSYTVNIMSGKFVSTIQRHTFLSYTSHLMLALNRAVGFSKAFDIVGFSIEDRLEFIDNISKMRRTTMGKEIIKWFHTLPEDEQFTIMLSIDIKALEDAQNDEVQSV